MMMIIVIKIKVNNWIKKLYKLRIKIVIIFNYIQGYSLYERPKKIMLTKKLLIKLF